jgi:hypothetical protein
MLSLVPAAVHARPHSEMPRWYPNAHMTLQTVKLFTPAATRHGAGRTRRPPGWSAWRWSFFPRSVTSSPIPPLDAIGIPAATARSHAE